MATTGLWQSRAVPPGFATVWQHDLYSLAELVHLRARLRTELTGSPVVAHPEREHWSERMVLIVDELASNGLRHGGPPVGATLSGCGDRWMIAITDSRPENHPNPHRGATPAAEDSVCTWSPTSPTNTAGPAPRARRSSGP